MDYSSAFYHRNILVGVFPPHNKNLQVVDDGDLVLCMLYGGHGSWTPVSHLDVHGAGAHVGHHAGEPLPLGPGPGH